MGRVYVSGQTRDAFYMGNFFSEETGTERVMLLETPQEAFYHRVNLISNAQYEILFSTFAFHSGVTSDVIVGALLHAAERGVRIHMLNNAVVGQMHLRYRNALVGHENINVYLFNRLNPFRPRYINSAMHCKYMIVDGKLLVLGGRNIGDKYYTPECFTGHVSLDREVLVYSQTTGGIISDVHRYFGVKIASDNSSIARRTRRASRWEAERDYFIAAYLAHQNSISDFDYYAATVAANRITLVANNLGTIKNDSIVAYNLMRMAMASDVVIAQSPYVAFTRRNLNRFIEVAGGRDFTLLTNSIASTPNLPSFSNYHVNRHRLASAGIAIYEFQSTSESLHGKTYLFDGRLTAIGSFNLNERSIRSDTEIMLVIDSIEFHNITLAAIQYQMAGSLRVGADNRYIECEYVEIAHTGWLKRASYRVAGHLLRPLRFMF